MPAFNRPRRGQGGFAAVEFALLALTFFTLACGIIEVARLLYVYNTEQEVTRRAAAAAVHVYPTDAAAVATVRRNAVFRTTSGPLMLAAPITDQHVRLSWLKWNLTPVDAGALLPTTARNRQVCMADPHAANCIRFVQAQICDPDVGGACVAPRSITLLPFVSLALPLHKATTIEPVVTLGYVPGTSPWPCPCP